MTDETPHSESRIPHFEYALLHVANGSCARRGRLMTPRGVVELPTFMPVGTVGTVKAVDIERLESTGAQIMLANTYHLALRPGSPRVAKLGGIHAMSGWSGPILTDSGGFQVFSLAERTKVTEHQVVFRSHIDGSLIELSPERAIEIQAELGSDIAMQLDHVIGLPAPRDLLCDAMQRSLRWAERCLAARRRDDQALFGIVQGGLDPELRAESAEGLRKLPLEGFAIGGLSVGEEPREMYSTISATVPHLPEDRPRYLMGVGKPADLVEAVHRGVDMFDCVMPTRNGRNAFAFTDQGPLRLRNECHADDSRPLEADCPCLACRRHSRGYLRHLFQAGEMLGPMLLSVHNLFYYQRVMAEIRGAIDADTFAAYRLSKLRGWGVRPIEPTPA